MNPGAKCRVSLAAIVVGSLIWSGTASADFVVNIDATEYGFAFPTDPAPQVGQLIAPFSLAPGGLLNQLTLGPGTYAIRNATGEPGANPAFTGWRFNGGDNWTWSVVVADDSTDRVVFYGDAGGVQGSQAAVAGLPDVQDFSGVFTLPQTTTLDFMIRDYFLPDNAGGVAVSVALVPAQAGAPEPSAFVLLVVGAVGFGLVGRRARRARIS